MLQKNTPTLSKVTFNTQLQVINNSNKLTIFLYSPISSIINIYSSCQIKVMSCISISSYMYQNSNRIYDVPRQTSQNYQMLNLMDPTIQGTFLECKKPSGGSYKRCMFMSQHQLSVCNPFLSCSTIVVIHGSTDYTFSILIFFVLHFWLCVVTNTLILMFCNNRAYQLTITNSSSISTEQKTVGCRF